MLAHPFLRRTILPLSAILVTACADPAPDGGLATVGADSRVERIERLLSTLAADSMEGRRAGTRGAHMAADFLAAELETYGVDPAGEDGYFQPVPLARTGPEGSRLALPSPELDFDTLPAEWILEDEVLSDCEQRLSEPNGHSAAPRCVLSPHCQRLVHAYLAVQAV